MTVVAPAAGRELELSVMAALCVATLVGSLNTSQLAPFIPEIADDLGQTTPVIGQAATAFFVTGALSGLLIGPAADHYGHRRVLMLGLAISSVSSAAGALAPNYFVLLLTRLLGGFGMAATIGIVFAIATSRYSGSVRLRALSIVTASFALIGIIGIPLLTGLSAWVGWRGAWLFVGGLATVALVVFAALGPKDDGRNRERIVFAAVSASYRALLSSRKMALFFAGSALQGALFLAAVTYNGAYFVDELDLSVQEFGLVAAISSAGFAAGSFVAGKLGNFDLRMLFSVTMALSGLLIAPVYLDQTGVVSSTLLVTLSIFMGGIGGVAMLNLLANHTPIGQATTLVFNESVFSFGAATGAAGGGLAISLQGFGALSLLLPLLGLAGGLLVWRPGMPVAAGTRAD